MSGRHQGHGGGWDFCISHCGHKVILICFSCGLHSGHGSGHDHLGGNHGARVIFLGGSRLCSFGTHLCEVNRYLRLCTCLHSSGQWWCRRGCSQGIETCAGHRCGHYVGSCHQRSGCFFAAWRSPGLGRVSISTNGRGWRTHAFSGHARLDPALIGVPASRRRHPKIEQTRMPV